VQRSGVDGDTVTAVLIVSLLCLLALAALASRRNPTW